MWRTIVIQNESNISIRNENLFIKKGGDEFSIPLRDISCLVLESLQIQVNTYVLYKISEYNIDLIICDDKHLPISYLVGINSNCRTSEVLNNQIGLSKVVKNNIWKCVIERKIYNQSLCLELLDLDFEKVKSISTKVKSNDGSNRESYAAREYFKVLFNSEHTRKDDVLFNKCLNYCYSIVRSNIARYCVGYGLNISLGLFHSNNLNGFNFVDDLIEVFRPIVDLYVYKTLNNSLYDDLTPELKRKLIQINSINVKFDNKKYCLDKCVDLYIANIKSCICNSSYMDIKLPILIDIEFHKYE